MDDRPIGIPEMIRPSLQNFASNFVAWNQFSNIQIFRDVFK
jgi:hypothetical protein